MKDLIKIEISKSYSLGVLFLALLVLVLPNISRAEEHGGHDDQAAQEEHEPGLVELKPGSESLFKLKVEILSLHDIAKEISAPGEVVLNAYKTGSVSLRIDGQVIRRLVRMGETVIKGQPLAKISSIQMSEAQQAYIVDVKEWARVEQLGRSVVSGRRYIEARSKWQSSLARLMALGLGKKQLKDLEKLQTPDGIFEAVSPIDGIVISDDFIEGQYIEAGGQLFMVSDESSIWVEASVSPSHAALFKAGDHAIIEHDGETHAGIIVQISHVISESTRTQIVRIEIDNTKDDLHPGQFVSTVLRQAETVKKLAVSENALVRTADGDWGVFIKQKPLHYKQVEVEVLSRQGELMVISGINEGAEVVTEGAFYLSAELAKAGFDPHGH